MMRATRRHATPYCVPCIWLLRYPGKPPEDENSSFLSGIADTAILSSRISGIAACQKFQPMQELFSFAFQRGETNALGLIPIVPNLTPKALLRNGKLCPLRMHPACA